MSKVGLVILDGWGIGDKSSNDAIHLANTPVFDGLIEDFPNATLLTDGEHVGLPKGQMGNSEVGHMNIGAGRIVYQELSRINNAITDNSFQENPTMQALAQKAKSDGKAVHLLGLVSDGGVHSSMDHLLATIDFLETQGITNIHIHAITDGRDCKPDSGIDHLKRLETFLEGKSTTIATVIGRYYAMDRDKRWERVKIAYDLYTQLGAPEYNSSIEGIKASYDDGIMDEFIKPFRVSEAVIKEGDHVFCFNFRTDRCREITMALTQQNFPEHGMKILELDYYTMTRYDETFKNIQVVFDKENLDKTLGQVLSETGKTQVRIAETEKYPHVTFFFSGGQEEEFPGESRIMAASPKVATYDLQPEMSAYEIRTKIVEFINKEQPDFICLNFANPDMVGHTGVQEAIIKACEVVDQCLGDVLNAGEKHGYEFIVIADHGNAEQNRNTDGSPHTAHTTNPVPFVLVTQKDRKVTDGVLADVAPTVLDLMQLPQPEQMTGKTLLL